MPCSSPITVGIAVETTVLSMAVRSIASINPAVITARDRFGVLGEDVGSGGTLGASLFGDVVVILSLRPADRWSCRRKEKHHGVSVEVRLQEIASVARN